MCVADRERGEVSAPRERHDAPKTQSLTTVASRRSHRVVRRRRRAERRVRQGLTSL